MLQESSECYRFIPHPLEKRGHRTATWSLFEQHTDWLATERTDPYSAFFFVKAKLHSFTLLNVDECFACKYVVYHMCVWCSQRSKEGMGFPGTRVTNGYEMPCGSWELSPPLQYQHAFLTTEPALQPPTSFLLSPFLRFRFFLLLFLYSSSMLKLPNGAACKLAFTVCSWGESRI